MRRILLRDHLCRQKCMLDAAVLLVLVSWATSLSAKHLAPARSSRDSPISIDLGFVSCDTWAPVKQIHGALRRERVLDVVHSHRDAEPVRPACPAPRYPCTSPSCALGGSTASVTGNRSSTSVAREQAHSVGANRASRVARPMHRCVPARYRPAAMHPCRRSSMYHASGSAAGSRL